MKFSKRQKELSNCNFNDLTKAYEQSERGLKEAAQHGDKKAMDKIMKCHRDVEYAILLKQLKGAKRS